MRSIRTICRTLTLTLLVASGAARAEYITVDLSSLVNSDLSTYTFGAGYPPPGVSTFNGIPFEFASAPSGSASVVGGLASVGIPRTYYLDLDLSGITTMYAIVNSAFGACGANVGVIAVRGEDGMTSGANLVQGVNVRDHYQGGFCNQQSTAAFTVPFADGIIYDIYRIDVSTATSNGTVVLDGLQFETYGMGASGEPFLAAVTFERGVPEPGTLALLGAGLGLAAFARRRRRAEG
jgi:PEP-CTERM motif-containing protein